MDKRLYKRLIEYYLFVTMPSKWLWWRVFDKWTVEIYPSTEITTNKFFAGTMERDRGVGGVTGLETVTLFLEDKKTNLNDIFLRAVRKNMIVITHELGHAIGIGFGWREKVKLRNDDWSGHRKGTKLNASTALIHDAHVEKWLYPMKVWVKTGRIFPGWKRITVQVLDMRKVIRERNKYTK